ncbi:MAG: LuxR family transcriptional regulator [Eggerthellaceae bacterium]|nr:LuxR family transcriptional regulator [Eggerthellaceae bacterium]
MALLTLAREAHRYPVLASVNKMGFVTFPIGDAEVQLTTLISLAVLIVIAFILAKTSTGSSLVGPVVCLVAAIIMTFGYFGKFEMADAGVLRVCSEFTQACGFIILIGWAALLYKNERDRSLVLLAYSFLLSGIVQALLAVLIPQAGILLCTMAPVFSVLLLWLYRYTFDANELVWSHRAPREIRSLETVTAGLLRDLLKHRSIAIVLACFCVYGLVCFTQSQTWLGAQDIRLAPLMIQLFSALGSILSAVVLIVLLRKDFNVWNDVVYKALIFMVFALSLVVSSFGQNNTLASVFTTFVDAGYKFILFFIWLYPLILFRGNGNATVFTISHAVFTLGVVLGSLSAVTPGVRFAATLLGLTILVIDLAYTLTRTLGSTQTPSATKTDSTRLKELEAREAEARAAEQEAQSTLAKYRHILFMVYLSETFGFTQREFEVFPYFLEGMKTKDIASTLFISQETVRTHRRNVYQKMDVHSQEELHAKTQSLRENDFPAFLANVSATSE